MGVGGVSGGDSVTFCDSQLRRFFSFCKQRRFSPARDRDNGLNLLAASLRIFPWNHEITSARADKEIKFFSYLHKMLSISVSSIL